jgi:hypothetical protein
LVTREVFVAMPLDVVTVGTQVVRLSTIGITVETVQYDVVYEVAHSVSTAPPPHEELPGVHGD